MNEPYKVIEPNMISVCMFCYPGRRIVEVFPDLRGVDISHGICPGHKAIMLADLETTIPLAKPAN